MNHCVPDFEMEDYYSIPSYSILNRAKKPSMPEDGIMELLWQNGQVVMQSQNQRSFKKPSPFKYLDAGQSALREIRSSSHHQQQQQQQQQQSVTDHLFMQEDEMASWLHNPLSDANFDHDFCADLLYPSSSTAVAPCVTSTATTSAPPPPPLGRVPQVSASAMVPASRPPIPPARRNELESTRIQNFGSLSKEQPGPSNSKSVAREVTVVDSSDTPAVAPESGASQAMPCNTEAASGEDNNNACANMSFAAVAYTQSAAVSVGASKDNIATCEATVTSSPGGSSASASAEPTAQKTGPAEDRKRKGREPDDAECHSEDAEFESPETKKQSRGSSSTKRSRAAEVHNLSERRRRDRINEKMRALQELIPRCNKSDKASMLDEAIEYLKSLQLQVQMMSMGCGMLPMMFPQHYMPTMGMGIGMGMVMDMGLSRPMMPFHNVMAGSGLPTPAASAHLDPRFPMPAFHMSPQVPVPDPSRIQPNNQSDAMLNPLGMQNPNQPRIPSFADPYQQYMGLHQMQLHPPQCQATAQPSSSKPSNSKGAENLENHPSGDMAR